MKRTDGKLLIVSGLSGSGKTSLVDAMLEEKSLPFKLEKVVSYTTREPRPGEVHGFDYVFISKEEFAKLNDDGFFIEVVCYGDNWYGTPGSILEKMAKGVHFILVADIRGSLFLQNKLHPNVKLIFVRTATLEESLTRLIHRDSNASKSIAKRARLNKFDFLFWRKKKRKFTLDVVNSDFDSSLRFLIIGIAKMLI